MMRGALGSIIVPAPQKCREIGGPTLCPRYTERTTQTGWARIILFLAVASLAASAAQAQDISRGKGIAQLWCSDCHLVDPQERKSGRNGARTFLSIARMKSTTEASLAAFLSTPHGRGGMPDLVLNRDEIGGRSAYILSLRKFQ